MELLQKQGDASVSIAPSPVSTNEQELSSKITSQKLKVSVLIFILIVIASSLIYWFLVSKRSIPFVDQQEKRNVVAKELITPLDTEAKSITPETLAVTKRNLYTLNLTSGKVNCITDKGEEVKELSGSDAQTFEILGEFNTISPRDSFPATFAKDKNHVYLDCYILEGVDPLSVKTIQETLVQSSSSQTASSAIISPYINDVHGVYYFGDREPYSNQSHRDVENTKIIKQPTVVDFKDFTVYSNHYAKSSSTAFYAGVAINNVDIPTFSVGPKLDMKTYTVSDASDKKLRFLHGKLLSENICPEMEKELPIAKELAGGKIVFIKDVTYSIGKSLNGGNCLKNLGSIDREVAPPDRINQDTFDTMAKEAKIKVVDLAPREIKFTVEKVLEVTDAEGNPSSWIVLVDNSGVRYKIPSVFFGENGADNNDQVIAVLQYDSKEYPITNDTFEDYGGDVSKPKYRFHLSTESIDVNTPLLSNEEAITKVKKDYGVDPLYQGGGKVWFKKPNSINQSGCGILALYDRNTRRYHDTDIPDCSSIDIAKTKPLYIEYCDTRDCLFGSNELQAIDLNTKRIKIIYSTPASSSNQTLQKECHRDSRGWQICTSDISLVGSSKLKIGVFQRSEKAYSLDSYSNTKLKDEYVDLLKFK